MNVKQLLQQLMGEVWEVNTYNKGYSVKFKQKASWSAKISIANLDEISWSTKEVGEITADSVLSLIDFLQANTKEGE